jgi:glycosyltransferase involved in cell wall biosynthesis
VFNGARYLREALDSLLAQTFDDLEVLVLDNASTDDTPAICASYVERDARVRYVRHRTNVGVVQNFNSAFRLTVGEYFKWAAHDDVCAPDFLRRCVDVLDADETVVLACPRVAGIDENGDRVDLVARPGPGQSPVVGKHLNGQSGESTGSPDVVARWRSMMRDLWWTPHLYGLIRADTLARTRLHAAHYMGDHILLAELALFGRFREIDEELLFTRVHPGRTSGAASGRQRLAVARPDQAVGPLSSLRVALMYPARVTAHVSSIRRAPLTPRERLTCYRELTGAVLRWTKDRGSRALLRSTAAG